MSPEHSYFKYKNYGWRPLLVNELVNMSDAEFIGRTVILFNPGIVWIHIPEFLVTAPQELDEGAIFFRDLMLKNGQWAYRDLVEKMELTDSDLSANGIFPDILTFKNNNPIVQAFFRECLEIDRKTEATMVQSIIEINSENEIVDNSHDALLYSLF